MCAVHGAPQEHRAESNAVEATSSSKMLRPVQVENLSALDSLKSTSCSPSGSSMKATNNSNRHGSDTSSDDTKAMKSARKSGSRTALMHKHGSCSSLDIESEPNHRNNLNSIPKKATDERPCRDDTATSPIQTTFSRKRCKHAPSSPLKSKIPKRKLELRKAKTKVKNTRDASDQRSTKMQNVTRILKGTLQKFQFQSR